MAKVCDFRLPPCVNEVFTLLECYAAFNGSKIITYGTAYQSHLLGLLDS